MQQVTEQQLLPRVHLMQMRTERFHTGFLSAALVTELKRPEASKNALLYRVLCRGTTLCPERENMAAVKARLGGLKMTPFARKLGERQLCGAELRFPEGHFAPGQATLERACALLGEVLTAPDTRGGMLRSDYVEAERQGLAQEIRARGLDGDTCAMDRLTELACPGERYAALPTGDEKTVLSIGYAGLSKHFRRAIPGAMLELFYCGSEEANHVAALLTQSLADLPREVCDIRPTQTDVSKNRQPAAVAVPGFGAETRTAVCFRVSDGIGEQDAPKLTVLHALLRQLVPEIRSSRVDEEKGMLLFCGHVRPERFSEQLQDAVQKLREGEISPECRRQAGETLLAELQRTEDDPAALGRWMTRYALLGFPCTPGEYGAICESITPEELSDAAGHLTFCGSYTLAGQEDSVCG